MERDFFQIGRGRLAGFGAILSVALLAVGAVRAEPMHGIAMYGAPQLPPDFASLPHANPDAPKGGTLKQAAIGSFDTLNPFSLKGTAAQGLDGLFYTRLMIRNWDEPFTLYPHIAAQVEVAENRSGISFTLNQDAKFHDGTPITSADVLFSFETMKEKGRPNQRRI